MDIKEFEPLFGNWTIDSFIGSGSFGKVYKIMRVDYGAIYYSALKWISIPQDDAELKQLRYNGMNEESITGYYEALIGQLTNEMQIMSRLRGHSNIVSYEDHQIVPKKNSIGYDVFIRMELLTSLNEHLLGISCTQADVIQLGIEICNALEICQRYNIIHRDIKPDNIFLSETGSFKLGDFGIARQLEHTATELSKKGTYLYMAPEVYKAQQYDTTVDLYSLGIVMYRLLNCGRVPFLPLAPNLIMPSDNEKSMVRRMRGEAMPKPVNATDRLGEIVLKSCAYDPKDRYSSPKQMREELQAIQISKGDAKYVYKDGDRLGKLVSNDDGAIDPNATVIIKENRKVNSGTSDFKISSIEDFEPLFGDWYVDSFIAADSFCKTFKIKREVTGGVLYRAMKWISFPQDGAELNQLRLHCFDNASIYQYYKEIVNNLTNETHLASCLKSQNSIVSYEDHCVAPKSNWMGYDIFIRMELLTSLNDYLHNHEITRVDLIRLGINLCEALELCQKFNIIHRNINPNNIYVAETGEFKLGNFENALQMEEEENGNRCFNLYVAPEVYKDERYDSSADLYSLGLMLYRLLNSGRLPFLPLAPASICPSDREQSFVRRMSGEQLPLPLNAQGRLGEIILRACAYDPKDRYSSPLQMREELQRIQFSSEEEKLFYLDGDILRDIVPNHKGIYVSQYTTFNETTVVALENDKKLIGLTRSQNELSESDSFAAMVKNNKGTELASIEKLDNGATLLLDFGVVPDLAAYNIDDSVIFQLLNEIEFNMTVMTESYRLKNENGELYYTDGTNFIWQYSEDDGVKKWLTEYEFKESIRYFCIYSDEERKLSEVDVHFETETYEKKSGGNYISCELQLLFEDEWISSSCLIIVSDNNESINCSGANANVDMRMEETYTFDECGNLLSSQGVLYSIHGDEAKIIKFF